MSVKPKILLIIALLSAGTGYFLFAQNTSSTVDVAHFNASLTHEAGNDLAAALKEMDVVYAAAPDNYLVNLRLGWLHYLNGDYGQSVTYYRRALELSQRQSIEALLGLRLPLAAQGDWSAAEDVYQQILKLDRSNYEANLRLGQIYLNRGENLRAKPYLDNVLKSYPSDYEGNLSSGWNDYSLSDPARSRTEFMTVLLISAGDTSATRGLQLLK